MRYLEREVPAAADPLATMMLLIRRAGYASYVVYEQEGCWSYAGGSVLRIGGGQGGIMWAGATDGPLDLAQAGRILAGSGVEDWRAYGWTTFEAGMTTPGTGAQLCLTIPQSEVRIADGLAHLRAMDLTTLDWLAQLVGAVPPVAADDRRSPVAVDLDDGSAGYRDLVQRAIACVDTTELRKVIVSRRLEVAGEIDIADSYERGRRATSPARSFLFDLGGMRAAGFGPEAIVRIDRREISAHLLAGTSPVGNWGDATSNAKAPLPEGPKEVYEHSITVADAMSAFSTLCLPGTAVIRRFMDVVERGSVRHLASTLAGELAAPMDQWSALQALLPGAVVTGVPKQAAIAAIRALEGRDRGLYGGAVITCDSRGGMDAALALRMVVQDSTATWLQVGAGITAASQPAREHAETCDKLLSIAAFLMPARGGQPQLSREVA